MSSSSCRNKEGCCRILIPKPDALLSIPSVSLVTDVDHLFDPSTGIYVHPSGEGRRWERPVSVELLDPDEQVRAAATRLDLADTVTADSVEAVRGADLVVFKSGVFKTGDGAPEFSLCDFGIERLTIVETGCFKYSDCFL